MTKVFIDGSAGTTGLQIHERLRQRLDIELLTVSDDRRKDIGERKRLMDMADVVFLCLPDAAAVEASELAAPETCVIDTSTAHRVSSGWVYGFPELGFAKEIAASKRIANPGCHATGFISVTAPLVKAGVLPADADLACFSLTGYSGGGKNMIAQYEDGGKNAFMESPGIYGLGQTHKHLPEMKKFCGLAKAPVFSPIVDDYYKGMASTVPFHMSQLSGVKRIEEVKNIYERFYADAPLISVAMADPAEKLYGSAMAGRDSLRIVLAGNNEAFTVTALFDNLGKGASGAAIENMNIVLGLDPATGLVL